MCRDDGEPVSFQIQATQQEMASSTHLEAPKRLTQVMWNTKDNKKVHPRDAFSDVIEGPEPCGSDQKALREWAGSL